VTELSDRPPEAGARRVIELTEHLFRHEAGKLVSVLTRIFGIERLELAEDVVQEALARALRTWPYYGIPPNPAAWLTQTAKNLALDVVRRERRFSDKRPAIAVSLEQWSTGPASPEAAADENEFLDDRLRLMFACCHPQIPPEAQTALALKTLCGFSVGEIAVAFLSTDAAIAKRLTRARQQIQDLRLPFEIPSGPEAVARLDAVRQTLYLLFNEGYKASTGDRLVREELCAEAIRLTQLLARHPVGDQPRTHALLALMLLSASRLPARVDDDGNLLLLQDQDRSRWDAGLIQRGFLHLGRSAEGEELSEYHLQAAIAACHCAAPTYEATDWSRIVSHYDELLRLHPSPIVALNRAVAIAQLHGPQAGIEAVQAITAPAAFESYYLLHAVRGELASKLGRPDEARRHFERASELAQLKSERSFLARRIHEMATAAGR
jgi:RNA polymerase sigma factor (sigma-70 family)